VLAVAAGPLTATRMQQVRGWTEDEWADATVALADRGLVTREGALTEAGGVLRSDVEAATDRAALRPWLALGPDATAALEDLMVPVIARLSATDLIPEANPIGVPRPT